MSYAGLLLVCLISVLFDPPLLSTLITLLSGQSHCHQHDSSCSLRGAAMAGEFYSKEILVVLLSEVQVATEEALRVLSEVKLNL